IGVDPTGAGFRKIFIHPMVVGDLSWVKGSYHSVSGLISTSWKKADGLFTLDVSIPANTSAVVYVPATNADAVMEGASVAKRAKGVKFLRMESGCALFEVVSGKYHFISK
ncbi:MAG: alpha-L-rhamnosidase C-terminal domain-containing protein, partial [Saprospiraceae bacterium]|nr:alpha-L-rhamnosidase C-terminal domain-containing protein [Saprospiraceae bacterium]